MCLGIADMCSGNYEVVKEAEDEDDEMKAGEKSPDEVGPLDDLVQYSSTSTIPFEKQGVPLSPSKEEETFLFSRSREWGSASSHRPPASFFPRSGNDTHRARPRPMIKWSATPPGAG